MIKSPARRMCRRFFMCIAIGIQHVGAKHLLNDLKQIFKKQQQL